MPSFKRSPFQASLVATLLASSAACAGQLDLSDPDDAFTMNRKIGCSTVDGEAVTYWWHGKAYSRRQGERDRLLFDVEGMNVP